MRLQTETILEQRLDHKPGLLAWNNAGVSLRLRLNIVSFSIRPIRRPDDLPPQEQPIRRGESVN
jgi:hypothetical protein